MRDPLEICKLCVPALIKLELPKDTWTEVKMTVKNTGSEIVVANISVFVIGHKSVNVPDNDYQFPRFDISNAAVKPRRHGD